jgi:hypothetical protein
LTKEVRCDTIDTEIRKGDKAMKATNAMITYVAEKYGVTSNEAVLMRAMVRAFILNRGVKYQDCKKTYEYLMKKKGE